MDVQFFVDRLKERSTWMGLLSVVAAMGITFTPEQQQAIVGACLGLAGLVAVVTRDKV